MTKRILLTAVALLTAFAAGCYAQDARALLDKTAALVGNKGGASASFKISGPNMEAQGSISIKGNKFQAQTGAAIVWYDGKTQWTYIKSTQEVNISTPTEAQQQQLNPYRFLNLYKSGYKMTAKSVKDGWEIHLTATDTKSDIKELYVTIDKNYYPKTVKMQQGAAWTTITVAGFTKKNLSDAHFQFNAKDYPKAEIIDLR